MAKSKDWIPKQDDDFYNKQKSYFELIVANKVAWGIPDSAVNQMISRRTAYEPLYYKSQEKKDRTAGDVDRHRQSRKTYEKELRTFINSYIRYNPAVPRDEKIAMGIPPRDIEPTPRPAISTVPVVEFKVLRGGEIEVVVRVEKDQTRPSMHPAADAVECRYTTIPVGQPAGSPADRGELPARPDGHSGGPPKSCDDCPKTLRILGFPLTLPSPLWGEGRVRGLVSLCLRGERMALWHYNQRGKDRAYRLTSPD